MMTDLQQRRRIVRAARYLVNAPYVHQARAGRDGVDCVGLLICVGDAVGAQVADEPNYPKETDGAKLLKCLEAVCDRVKRGRDKNLGDILVFRRGRAIWHTGIVTCTEPDMMVHAWSRYTPGVVREEEVSDQWERTIHSVWRYRL